MLASEKISVSICYYHSVNSCYRYVHAELHGASSTVIKNHKPLQPVPPLTLNQAGCFTVCSTPFHTIFHLNILFYVHELNQIVIDAGQSNIFYGSYCQKSNVMLAYLLFNLIYSLLYREHL